MAKLFHHLICAFNIIRGVINSALKEIRNRFVSFFRFIKCLIILKKPADRVSAGYDLSRFYPDPGRLSRHTGYRHERTALDLSIIIPMYNVERFICECLDSILSQKTDYTYEIILVDDGSLDGTAEKVSVYLDRDDITLLSQENRGQSVARNNALYESRGKYIMFVDGDDYLLPDAIQNLMDAAIKNDADIAEGTIAWVINRIPDKDDIDGLKTKPHIESYSKNPDFVISCNGYSVAKVYRRELWETVRFPEGYIFEDTITRYILRRKANKVAFIGRAVYAYRRNNSSSTHSGMSPKLLDWFWVFSRYIEMCKEQNLPFDKTFYTMALSGLCINTVALNIQDKELKTVCFNKLCEEFDLIYKYKRGRLPFALKLSEKALIKKNMAAWEYNANTILKYNLIKKYREGV